MERREFSKIAALTGAGLLVAPAAWASSNPGNVAGSTAPGAALTAEDEQFLKIISELDALPEDLKRQTPTQGGNYEAQLTAQLDGLKSVNSVSTSDSAVPAFNWAACVWEVAKVIVQYGIPVVKVVGWLKQLWRMYRSVTAIIDALKDGRAFVENPEITEEGAKIIEMLLGLEGVTNACFG